MKKKGFTLIELMVVIMIVGILAAVAIPILRQKIEYSKSGVIEDKYYEGVDPNQLQAYKDTFDRFEKYLGSPLYYATAGEAEKFLLDYRKPALQQKNLSEAEIEETLQFERKVLMGWVDTAAEVHLINGGEYNYK